MHSEDTSGLEIAKKSDWFQRVSSETFLTLWAQVHWQLACNDSTRWRSPELAPINNEDELRFFWKLAQHAFRRHFATWNCKKNRFRLELSVLKPSYLYGHRYTIDLTVPCWQLACNAGARLPSPELAPRKNDNRLLVFLQVGSCEIGKKWDGFLNIRSLNLPTSMGRGTPLTTLSHAGSLLAMPAPDCPAWVDDKKERE